MAKNIYSLGGGSLLGMWLYVIVASLLGVIKEPFWWGGEGWFLPGFGTVVLAFGVWPIHWIAQKYFKQQKVIVSTRHFIAVGCIHGLIFLPIFRLFASATNQILLGSTMTNSGAIAEIVIAIAKICLTFLVSGIGATLFVTTFLLRRKV